MASPGTDAGPNHQGRRDQSEPSPEPAFREAQKWIEAVTGRTFGDKDFRGGLENGILLCELLSSIRPGLVKKINRLPTPIAGLDNLTMFLRGCEELGLKGSQLFDPGDLQDTSIRANLTYVLITIYWLGKSANCCTSYNGPTLNLKEFEGLLSQMKKESEDTESPKRCVRDSGYIDCWDSERSESLSPPRHGRDDSFDSLDSFGSRSQQTPSPDVRANSDGRGSDSEGDAPHRKLPDVRKDDMLARRTSYNEPRATVPFNQYLPNKSNQSAYVPTPLRKKRTEGEDSRKSWSTATTPVSSDRPFRSMSMIDMRYEEEVILQPHSQSQHEHLHNQYNKVKEEEDHWQDDLARWKNRRRSASQDLIKKEEERKMMEKMMTAEQAYSLRRKSIKTYKEIVEEKERREQELHDAYRKARTPEEAAAVLQRYALRFTISDAILERLQIPQPREKSTPVQESTSIMQPSVPVPIPPTLVPIQTHILAQASNQIHTQPKMTDYASTYTPAPSKPLPLLTPKPYSQPKHIQVGHKPVKVDGLVRINGEVTTENSTKLSSPSAPAPSASQEDPVTTDGPNDLQQTPAHTKPPQEPPITLFLRGIVEEQREEVPDAMQSSKEEVVSTTLFESTLKGEYGEFLFCLQKPVLSVTSPFLCVYLCLCVCLFLPTFPHVCVCVYVCQTETPILNLAKRVDHWTWDPNEERKRQERWQQEQERLLQEKYQQEQEKLKQEWEKAQKEVEEEERRHNEEVGHVCLHLKPEMFILDTVKIG
uniref:Calponin-homology (CH) domain-containing protein n=2 Tax=Denticeps clupeoides TaxID=299321 RepID=A0AAY4A8N1_9TELE